MTLTICLFAVAVSITVMSWTNEKKEDSVVTTTADTTI